MSSDLESTLVTASDVQIGDRLRCRDGTELTVTRIDLGFFGRPDMLAFIEDSATQWFKMPAGAATEVELVGRAGAG